MSTSHQLHSAGEVASESMPIFGIFEGGGAKGIAHVGAYAAADEIGFEFVGVAGASAGSIVAALIAVGFSPAEIFDGQQPGAHIFATHGLTPLGVLGEADWRAFQRLRRHWRLATRGGLAVIAGTLCTDIIGWQALSRVLAAATALFLAGAYFWGRGLLRRRGIFDPAHFAAVFNRVLRQRVQAGYEAAGKDASALPQLIRFRDIDPLQAARFCRLKVVATDISGQQLRLFDHRTPDVVVAEAVAASIAIPGIFKPARIPSYEASASRAPLREYADGGLVSNLPVWCFSEEKAATERRTPDNAAVPIVAFTLDEPIDGPPSSLLTPFAYCMQVLRAGIFGGQTVVQEFVRDLHEIRLGSSVGVLDFDAGWEDAKRAHDVARRKALVRLRRRLVEEPREWSDLLESTCVDVQRTVNARLAALGQPGITLRAAVFEPIRPPRGPTLGFFTAYGVTHSHNMRDDPDDRLTLDAECPGVPEAFEQRTLTLFEPAKVSIRKTVMTKYERALVRRSVKSAICVPIFEDLGAWNVPRTSRNQPLAVVALDCDADIIGYLQDVPEVLESITEATFRLGSLLVESQAGVSNE